MRNVEYEEGEIRKGGGGGGVDGGGGGGGGEGVGARKGVGGKDRRRRKGCRSQMKVGRREGYLKEWGRDGGVREERRKDNGGRREEGKGVEDTDITRKSIRSPGQSNVLGGGADPSPPPPPPPPRWHPPQCVLDQRGRRSRRYLLSLRQLVPPPHRPLCPPTPEKCRIFGKQTRVVLPLLPRLSPCPCLWDRPPVTLSNSSRLCCCGTTESRVFGGGDRTT
ncbi:hypothetical protein E2C01_089351 [Portunus trituberculatus]|uniref:Uncharacterized protein n=1 Tax=Portunus trituberculatus TaxID=210409 RepID=A0A5B7JHY0_PORTR|nr:hypothetical protein [Portunus trituberculatus]